MSTVDFHTERYFLNNKLLNHSIIEVCNNICNNICNELWPYMDNKTWELLAPNLAWLLNSFAIDIGSEGFGAFHWTLMRHIHKRHRSIIEHLRDILCHLPEEEDGRQDEEVLSVNDKMATWFPVSFDEVPERVSTPEALLRVGDYENDSDPELGKYCRIIFDSRAYAQLLSNIRRELSLDRRDYSTGNAYQTIRTSVLDRLPLGRISRHRAPRTYKVAFHLPSEFPTHVLRNSMTWVVSPGGNAHWQLVTVGNYMEQAWPSTGLELLDVLQAWETNLGSKGRHSKKNVFVQTGIGMDTTASGANLIWFTGSPYAIAERAEQLAWLSAATQYVQGSTLHTFSPEITEIGDEITEPPLESSFGDSEDDSDWDRQWTIGVRCSIFHDPSTLEILQSLWSAETPDLISSIPIVCGFPILRHSVEGRAVEIPSEVFIALVSSTIGVDSIGEVVIQGPNSLWKLVGEIGGTLVWHPQLARSTCGEFSFAKCTCLTFPFFSAEVGSAAFSVTNNA
ncbi:hypothetical protein QBC40DRAFT_11873 [Triangularia verruculosa]|uniref:Uncharacterized protein n=1 Tax=Triangularia verruculosa TaxID=2587418 RepID=A0AAN6X8J7_9PEZI|nr:hypothetical protein QBC40DRAFT_11873 [Triangularia verruculosa]